MPGNWSIRSLRRISRLIMQILLRICLVVLSVPEMFGLVTGPNGSQSTNRAGSPIQRFELNFNAIVRSIIEALGYNLGFVSALCLRALPSFMRNVFYRNRTDPKRKPKYAIKLPRCRAANPSPSSLEVLSNNLRDIKNNRKRPNDDESTTTDEESSDDTYAACNGHATPPVVPDFVPGPSAKKLRPHLVGFPARPIVHPTAVGSMSGVGLSLQRHYLPRPSHSGPSDSLPEQSNYQQSKRTKKDEEPEDPSRENQLLEALRAPINFVIFHHADFNIEEPDGGVPGEDSNDASRLGVAAEIDPDANLQEIPEAAEAQESDMEQPVEDIELKEVPIEGFVGVPEAGPSRDPDQNLGLGIHRVQFQFDLREYFANRGVTVYSPPRPLTPERRPARAVFQFFSPEFKKVAENSDFSDDVNEMVYDTGAGPSGIGKDIDISKMPFGSAEGLAPHQLEDAIEQENKKKLEEGCYGAVDAFGPLEIISQLDNIPTTTYSDNEESSVSVGRTEVHGSSHDSAVPDTRMAGSSDTDSADERVQPSTSSGVTGIESRSVIPRGQSDTDSSDETVQQSTSSGLPEGSSSVIQRDQSDTDSSDEIVQPNTSSGVSGIESRSVIQRVQSDTDSSDETVQQSTSSGVPEKSSRSVIQRGQLHVRGKYGPDSPVVRKRLRQESEALKKQQNPTSSVVDESTSSASESEESSEQKDGKAE